MSLSAKARQKAEIRRIIVQAQPRLKKEKFARPHLNGKKLA
jgi:hypothetical protein